MSDSEAFTLVTTSSQHKIYDDYEEVNSGHYADLDTSMQKALRQQYPELTLTVTPASNSMVLFTHRSLIGADNHSPPVAVRRRWQCRR